MVINTLVGAIHRQLDHQIVSSSLTPVRATANTVTMSRSSNPNLLIRGNGVKTAVQPATVTPEQLTIGKIIDYTDKLTVAEKLQLLAAINITLPKRLQLVPQQSSHPPTASSNRNGNRKVAATGSGPSQQTDQKQKKKNRKKSQKPQKGQPQVHKPVKAPDAGCGGKKYDQLPLKQRLQEGYFRTQAYIDLEKKVTEPYKEHLLSAPEGKKTFQVFIDDGMGTGAYHQIMDSLFLEELNHVLPTIDPNAVIRSINARRRGLGMADLDSIAETNYRGRVAAASPAVASSSA